jgi:hypothetical protein
LTRTYHVDQGYVTIPEANKIVLRILNIIDRGDKSHYKRIYSGTKKGLYGGKKYGSRYVPGKKGKDCTVLC